MMLPETSAKGGKTAIEKIVSNLSSSPVMNGIENLLPSLCFCAVPFDHDRELDDIVNNLYECLDNAETEGIAESTVVFITPDSPLEEK